jgi:hypothetical protein
MGAASCAGDTRSAWREHIRESPETLIDRGRATLRRAVYRAQAEALEIEAQAKRRRLPAAPDRAIGADPSTPPTSQGEPHKSPAWL